VEKEAQDMIEIEVYASGIRDTAKVLELDSEVQAFPGLRYKIDANHDIVYFEMDSPVVTIQNVRALFRRIGIEGHFVGSVPPELKPKAKTQLLQTNVGI
jgi:hypothetical protein